MAISILVNIFRHKSLPNNAFKSPTQPEQRMAIQPGHLQPLPGWPTVASPETTPSSQPAWCTCRRKKVRMLRRKKSRLEKNKQWGKTLQPLYVLSIHPYGIKLDKHYVSYIECFPWKVRGSKENRLDINVTNLQTSRTFLCSGRGMPTSNGPRANRTSCKLPCVTNTINFAAIVSLKTHKLEHLESELTCRNTVHRHSRQTLRHIVRSRTPVPATQARYKPFLSFLFFFNEKHLYVWANTKDSNSLVVYDFY